MLNQIAYQTYILFFCFLIFRKLFSNNRIKQVKRWKSKLIIIHPNPKVKALRKNYQLCLRKLFTFKNSYNMICILIYGSSSTRLLFKTKQRTGKKVVFLFLRGSGLCCDHQRQRKETNQWRYNIKIWSSLRSDLVLKIYGIWRVVCGILAIISDLSAEYGFSKKLLVGISWGTSCIFFFSKKL